MSDLHQPDEFETAVLAAVGRDDLTAACDTVLAAAADPRAMRRLRTFPRDVRSRLAARCVERYRTAGTQDARAVVLTAHAALLARGLDLLEDDGFEAAVLAALWRDDVVAAFDTMLAAGDLPRAMERLLVLPEEHRRLLRDHAYLLYGDGAMSLESREAVCGALQQGLDPLGWGEVEALVKAAAEAGDMAAVGELFLTDVRSPWFPPEALPPGVLDRLADHCVGLYAAARTPERRGRVVALHALVSSGRAEDLKASDHMSADRQRLLAAWTWSTLWVSETAHLAWVELLSGRDIPVSLGAAIRRLHFDGVKRRRLPDVVRLLARRHPVLNAGEQWSDRVLADLADLPAVWTDLVAYAVTVPGGTRPGTTWEKQGRALLAGVEGPAFRDRVPHWLALVGGPPTSPREGEYCVDPFNSRAARGLVWLLSFLPEGPRTARDLGTVLERALLKVPGAGPGMPALANACAYVLCGMAEGAAPEELARLTTQVTYRPTLRILQAGLAAHGWGNRTPTARNV